MASLIPSSTTCRAHVNRSSFFEEPKSFGQGYINREHRCAGGKTMATNTGVAARLPHAFQKDCTCRVLPIPISSARMPPLYGSFSWFSIQANLNRRSKYEYESRAGGGSEIHSMHGMRHTGQRRSTWGCSARGRPY